MERLVEDEAAGREPPDGVRVDGDGAWWAPVVRGWSSVDDGEARAYLVTSNRLVETGGWLDASLGPLLDDLRLNAQRGLDGVGFSTADVDKMVGTTLPLDPHDGPAGGPPPQARAKPNDAWLLGDHRLVCGSCTDKAAVEQLLVGEVPAMLVTDPPYSSGGWQEAGKAAGSIGTRHADGSMPSIANDRLSTRGYQALMSAMLNACPVDVLYVFTDWRMWVNLFDVAESSGFGVRSMIVWDKGSPGLGRGWRSQHELVMHAAKAKIEWDKHAAVGNVISLPRTGNPLHPTQKPTELLDQIIGHTPGATVYDPFAGSGTTLIAADRQHRHCLAMELDPGYCDVILDRWERHGGMKPKREPRRR